MIDGMKRNLLKAIGLGAISGCAGAQSPGRSVTTLTYNYTGRYIGDVVVDGAWTGGANAYGMGGGAQGLLAPSDPNRQVVLKVKWSVGSYYSVTDNTYTRAPVEEKSAGVEVARPYPANPSYLVLHFYPDGHVEAELEADRPKRRIPPPAGYHR
jgi:Protein of unknown function (DUF3304)